MTPVNGSIIAMLWVAARNMLLGSNDTYNILALKSYCTECKLMLYRNDRQDLPHADGNKTNMHYNWQESNKSNDLMYQGQHNSHNSSNSNDRR